MLYPKQQLSVGLVLGVLVITSLLFLGSFDAGFVYDDYYLIETNPTLADPGPLGSYLAKPLFQGAGKNDLYQWAPTGMQYWRPFVKFAFLMQYRLFGLAPRGWHTVSFVVHLLCVLLAVLWLRRRLASPAGHATTAAALGGLLFALHPSRVEAVSWISGSGDLWMGFWVLLGLVTWERGTRVASLCAGCCFALAFLSKETALVVPACLAIDLVARGSPSAEAVGLDRKRLGPGRWGQWGRATFPVAAVLALRFVLLPPPESLHAGGLVHPLQRCLSCLGIYVEQVFWPVHPSTQLGLMTSEGTFELPLSSVILGAVALAAVILLTVRAWRHPAARPWLADTSWFFLPLLPALQFVPMGYTTLASERFLYLPLLGIAALFARAAQIPMQRWTGEQKYREPIHVVVGVCAILLFTARTMKFEDAFRSNVALWTYETRLKPQDPLLHLYLARAQREQGNLQAALVAAHASYAEATRDDARTEAAVEWATIRLAMLQRTGPELDHLCDFLDALAAGGPPAGSVVTLDAPGTRLTVRVSREFRERLAGRTSFHSARAVANARAGRYQVAAKTFEKVLTTDRTAATYANLARAQACAERWDDARATLADGQRRYPAEPQLDALRKLVTEGKKLAEAPDSKLTSSLEWAQLWLDLGAPSLIRRQLEAVPASPEATAYLAVADALDGNVTRAYERIAEARERYPDHAALWNAARAEVTSLAPATPPVGKTGVDALFR